MIHRGGKLRSVFIRSLVTVHTDIEAIFGTTDVTGMTGGIISGIIIQGAFTNTIAITGDIRCMTISISVLWCANVAIYG